MPNRPSKRTHVALWVLQSVLAALFVFAGVMKLAMPPAQLARLASMPAPFLEFIGVCELAGGLGLVLPGLLRMRTWLTPLAAAGLVLIMIGATLLTVATHGFAAASFPLVTGILAAVVAIRRMPRHDAIATNLHQPA
jgi:uncharacterized membrane protein YphA (DoxX/SURF4 family)